MSLDQILEKKTSLADWVDDVTSRTRLKKAIADDERNREETYKKNLKFMRSIKEGDNINIRALNNGSEYLYMGVVTKIKKNKILFRRFLGNNTVSILEDTGRVIKFFSDEDKNLPHRVLYLTKV